MSDIKPRWEVERDWNHGILNREPDWQECRYRPEAYSPMHAAETWAEYDDCRGDYTIVGGTPARIRLREEGSDGPWLVVDVEGETVPEYTAYEVEPSTVDSGSQVKP